MTRCIRVISLVAMGLILPGLGFAQERGTKPRVAAGMDGLTTPEGQIEVIDQRSQPEVAFSVAPTTRSG